MAASSTRTGGSLGLLLVVVAVIAGGSVLFGSGQSPFGGPASQAETPETHVKVSGKPSEGHHIVIEAGYERLQGEPAPNRPIKNATVDDRPVTVAGAGRDGRWQLFRYEGTTPHVPKRVDFLLDTGNNSFQAFCRIFIDGARVDESPALNFGHAECHHPSTHSRR